MSDLSFVSAAPPVIEPGGVHAKWLEPTGQYIVQLGRDPRDRAATALHLTSPIARVVIESLCEAMIAQGETVDLPRPAAERAALADLAELTREIEFQYPRTGLGPRLRAILARLGHVADASESSDEDRHEPEIDGVTVISAERLAELREQLAAEKRAAAVDPDAEHELAVALQDRQRGSESI